MSTVLDQAMNDHDEDLLKKYISDLTTDTLAKIDPLLLHIACDCLTVLGLCRRRADGKGELRWMAWSFGRDGMWAAKFEHVRECVTGGGSGGGVVVATAGGK